MARKPHPKRDIEAAIRYAETHGWTIEAGGAHAWGRMYCPWHDDACRCGEFCITSIWSTPRNAITHGRQLKRVVDHCLHLQTKH